MVNHERCVILLRIVCPTRFATPSTWYILLEPPIALNPGYHFQHAHHRTRHHLTSHAKRETKNRKKTAMRPAVTASRYANRTDRQLYRPAITTDNALGHPHSLHMCVSPRLTELEELLLPPPTPPLLRRGVLWPGSEPRAEPASESPGSGGGSA